MALPLTMLEKLKRFILDQTTDALRNAWKIKEKSITAMSGMTRAQRLEMPRTYLVHADAEYEERLCIAVFVARLYLGLYSHQPHRLKRLVRLLRGCIDAGDQLRNIASDITYFPGLSDSRDQLHMTTKTLRACVESLEILSEDNVSASGEQVLTMGTQAEPDENSTFSPMAVCAKGYLRQASCYDWRRDAPSACDDADLASVEKLNVKFERLSTSNTTLYSMDSEETESDHSGWNAIFTSQSANLRQDKEQYVAIRNSIVAARDERQLGGLLEAGEQCPGPVDLAVGMDQLHADIGFIFPEDQSVVVWPLGRRRSDSIVLLAEKGAYNFWRYSAIQLLSKGASPRGTSWLPDHMLMSCGYTHENYLADLRGRAQRRGSDWKPFPLLRLPRELRDQIYEEYLEEIQRSDGDSGTFRIEDLVVPRLAQACHQIRDEVMSVYFSATFTVDLRKYPRGPTLHSRSACILTRQNRWIEKSKACSSFKNLKFRSRWGTETLQVAKLSAGPGLSLEGTGWAALLGPRLRIFEEFLGIVVEDKTTEGLSANEIDAIADAAGTFQRTRNHQGDWSNYRDQARAFKMIFSR